LHCSVEHVLEGGIGGMIPRPRVTVDMVGCWAQQSPGVGGYDATI